ncbi:MAG: hypothetical protein Q8Q09_07685 [Deltaproteobacteria bacterium]|nr:hypothetical protein [Deltaproteobacteria bacterium]
MALMQLGCERTRVPHSAGTHNAGVRAIPSANAPSDAGVDAAQVPDVHTVIAAADSAADAATEADSALPREIAGATGATSFLSIDERVILRRLCTGEVTRLQRNTGGSTISFRVWFADGGRGLFKPQQSNSVANFRAEIAAYRMSRALQLHRTPPSCGRTLPRAMLQQTADRSGDQAFSERVMREIIGRGDEVPGAMIYWVPGGLENVPGSERYPDLLDTARPLADTDRTLAENLSTLLLFDFLNDNIDRWSGGNILRQRTTLQNPTPMMLFMDNGAAFTIGRDNLGARPTEQAARLARVTRVSRSFVARLRALTTESLGRELRSDPLGSPVGDNGLAAILTRRDRALAHIDATAQSRGESLVYAFE